MQGRWQQPLSAVRWWQVMRRLLTAVILAAMLIIGAATAAVSDPAFGPGAAQGQGNNAPHETPNQCHPPGQTNDLPQCK